MPALRTSRRARWLVAAAVPVMALATAVGAASGFGADDPSPTPPQVQRRTAFAPATGIDLSGPCDEAEHADDPRCTGGAGEQDGRDDNRGHGSDDDHEDDDSGHGGHGSDD